MKSKLQPRQRVRVYQKPLTNEDFEGMATLVEFDSASEGYGTERWMVRFDGEDGAWPRDVKPENLIPEGESLDHDHTQNPT